MVYPIDTERVTPDFLTWKSFPSSLKLENVTEPVSYVWPTLAEGVPVTPSKPLRVEVYAKQVDSSLYHSGVRVDAWTGEKWYYAVGWLEFFGTFNWKKFVVTSNPVQMDAKALKVMIFALGPKGKTTWYDDLRIYQDDILIYENKFTGLWPLTSVIAPIATGLGVVRLRKKG